MLNFNTYAQIYPPGTVNQDQRTQIKSQRLSFFDSQLIYIISVIYQKIPLHRLLPTQQSILDGLGQDVIQVGIVFVVFCACCKESIKVQQFLTISMKTKQVGSIKIHAEKSVGRLYRPSSSQSRQSIPNNPPRDSLTTQSSLRPSASKKRVNSVGKIYNTHIVRKQSGVQGCANRRGLRELINYEEMQNKLSSYLACTIKTNGRQKYNYLSNHSQTPLQQFQLPSKRNYCEMNFQPRSNILQMADYKRIKPFDDKVKQDEDIKITINSNKAQKERKKNNESGFRSNKENSCFQRNTGATENKGRKDGTINMFASNNYENKTQLSDKLIKIINNYETKNQILTQQLQRLEQQPKLNKPLKEVQKNDKLIQERETLSSKDQYSTSFLNDLFTKLVEHNMKGICLAAECDGRLQELWKSIHRQVVLDQRVRIIKMFIGQASLGYIVDHISSARIKKIQASSLKINNAEEYDPFLVQKFSQLFKTNSPNLSTKGTVKWVADQFIKCHEESEHHWLKFLSQEKIECAIRSMTLQKEISSLRHNEAARKDLSLRDFTRWLSTLYKANLRNRNVFHIFNKFKGMSYVGRFIELLEEKAGRGQEFKKLISK